MDFIYIYIYWSTSKCYKSLNTNNMNGTIRIDISTLKQIKSLNNKNNNIN